MSNLIENKTEDTYKSHWCHQSLHTDCSECRKENRLVLARKTVNFDETLKFFGDINKVIYGINPYE